MCLSTVTEKYDKPSNVIISAWKSWSPAGVPSFYQSYKGSMTVPMDQWIIAESKLIKADDGKTYDTGFHVYESEETAKSLGAYRRVYVRKIHTRGTQGGKIVLIAEEMYIPLNQHDWPPKPDDSTLNKLGKKILGKGGNA